MELEKLLENGKITASCQTNLSLKNTIGTRFSIFNFFLSVPPFVFAVLFIPSFHVLSSYCISVSLDTQFGGSSHCLIFDEIS